jgi:hypothetical protein
MKAIIGLFAVTLVLTVAAFAQESRGEQRPGQGRQQGGQPPQQRGGERGVGNGHIPAHGPAPVRTPPRSAAPAPAGERGGHENARPSAEPNRGSAPQENQHRSFRDQPDHPDAPHVHAGSDQWVGHDTGRDDPHYHLDHPWEHGRFNGDIGPRHVWRLRGGDRDRFNVDGHFFRLRPTTMTIQTDGYGIATTSSFIPIPTTPAGTSPTMSGSVRTRTLCIWEIKFPSRYAVWGGNHARQCLP